MATINDNYLKLKAGYLFPEIARRVNAFAEAHPDAKIIRLGIGDVTEPLPQACRDAMIKAVEDMGDRSTFKGYGPEQGYAWLREKIAAHDFQTRGCQIDASEIFVSDGSKCDTGNILDIFGDNNTIAVTDPVYPVYVDTNVMAGHTGEANEKGEYEGFVYLPITAENNFTAQIPSEKVDLIYLCFPNNPNPVEVHLAANGHRACPQQRSVPLIVTINFTVGAIVAQQGIFELLRFGASTYVVDLIGILVLRELGVLLTSIMIAGRSGSAITAEIGSMKVREEIDALQAMGLSPMEVLVVPRILALTLSLPLLTFVADMSALFGGLLMSWWYGGISPAAFIALLQTAVGLKTFFVGLIKAPFMGLVIGLIATQEGLATSGSAESLGWQVTASVVKSIFTVIILDGLFAIFFTSINY